MTAQKSDKTEFEAAYASLNKAQKQAVDTIEGPVMVIAGPGTGKTQILALRIANILRQTDSRPENILALTFTDAGAHAMRERLRRYIGDDAYHVAVHTFHSLAGELIKRYPDSYPNIIGGRVISDLERFDMLESIIGSGRFKTLRPAGDPLYYVKKIPGALSDLKKENIDPDTLAGRIADLETTLEKEPKYHEKGAHKGKIRGAYATLEKRVHKLRDLNGVYRLYQTTLRDKRLFDYEDMIVETASALLKNEDMLRDLQETYHYLLADEHQDVNQAQNRILELLAEYHDQPNIFVVGDEKQAIYRFQGASLDNFLYFQDRFKNTNVISLTDNYRSTEDILNVSHELIKTDDPELSKLRVPLRASGNKNKEGRRELCTFSHQAIEDEWVVDEVKTALENGVVPEEVAIITRFNRDVEHFANLLRSHGISVKPSADSDILAHPVTKTVENLLGAVLKINDEAVLFECLLGSWWQIPAGDLARVFSSRSAAWPLYRLISDRDKLIELKVTNPGHILRVAELLETVRSLVSHTAPHLLLHKLVNESGLLDHLTEADPLESTRVLRRLYDDIEAMVITDQAITLYDIVRQLEQRRAHNLPLLAPFTGVGAAAVNVMTAHKSKGLEFHTVIIPRATDKAFGKAGQRDLFKLPLMGHAPLPEFTAEDDEKRLLYVAMTRAKNDLLLSVSETDQEGNLLDLSRFLVELAGEHIDKKDVGKKEEDFDPAAIFQTAPGALQIDQDLLRELFLARGLSVTHLNNYLEDPLKYYYENLLRKPHPRGLSLLRGEAAHAVLEAVVARLKKGQTVPDSALNDLLRQALDRLPLNEADAAALHETVLEALLNYLPRLTNTVDERSETEHSIRTTLKLDDADLPEVPLTGNLDRVDRAPDGSILRVVDYKTGKPKSLNEVEGKTKNSQGNYKRQLVFYALLLQLDRPEALRPDTEFVLSFIEPKANSGEVVEYSFTVTKDEIAELAKEVERVAKEIISGEKFW